MAVTPPLIQGLAFLGTHGTKEAFLNLLRTIFADPAVMEETYLYKSVTEDVQKFQEGDDEGGANGTNIRIYKSYPQRILTYPAIIISMGGFDGSQRYLGEVTGEISDSKDPATGYLAGRTFGGYDIMPVHLTVYARERPNDRDRLTDILRIVLQIAKKGLASRYGLSWVNVDVSPDQEEITPRSQFPIFKKTIILQCQTDWNWFLSQDQAELIHSVLVRAFMARNSGDPGQLIPPAT